MVPTRAAGSRLGSSLAASASPGGAHPLRTRPSRRCRSPRRYRKQLRYDFRLTPLAGLAGPFVVRRTMHFWCSRLASLDHPAHRRAAPISERALTLSLQFGAFVRFGFRQFSLHLLGVGSPVPSLPRQLTNLFRARFASATCRLGPSGVELKPPDTNASHRNTPRSALENGSQSKNTGGDAPTFSLTHRRIHATCVRPTDNDTTPADADHERDSRFPSRSTQSMQRAR